MFVGVYERQLDERGRVALPSPFRSTIGEQCYVTFGSDGCVQVMSDASFRVEAQELIDAVKAGEVSRSRQRAFSSSVVAVNIDKQGRITLDQRLREHGGLDLQQPVTVLGALDRIELWQPGRFDAQAAAGQSELAAAQD